jgi:hypothetical protein
MNFSNNFYGNSSSQGNSFNQGSYCTFNPHDKVVELYERLVQVEKDKNEYLEKLYKDK